MGDGIRKFLPGVTLRYSPPVCAIGKEIKAELFGDEVALENGLELVIEDVELLV